MSNLSINFSDFSVSKSAKPAGGNVINSAELLAKIATLTQLNKLAEKYLGKAFTPGTSKIEGCKKLYAAMLQSLTAKTSKRAVVEEEIAEESDIIGEEETPAAGDLEDEQREPEVSAPKGKKGKATPVAKAAPAVKAPKEESTRADRTYVLNGKVKTNAADHNVLKDLKAAITELAKTQDEATADEIVELAKGVGNYDWSKVNQSNKGVFSWWSRFLKAENAIIVEAKVAKVAKTAPVAKAAPVVKKAVPVVKAAPVVKKAVKK